VNISSNFLLLIFFETVINCNMVLKCVVLYTVEDYDDNNDDDARSHQKNNIG